MSRELVFISHANPADNDFVVWLGSRLSSMGYKVWADIRDLRGGSKHWREIEKEIRENSAKVLVVTTRASKEAEGVEKEINIALGIEKELSLKNFIVQLKLDDLPYSQLPPALNNRLAVPFNKSWGDGLRELVEQLDDEAVPKLNVSSSSTSLFSSVLQVGRDEVDDVLEPAFGSWLPIQAPKKLRLYRFPGSTKTIQDELQNALIPAFAVSDTVISFAMPEAVAYGAGIDPGNLKCVDVETDVWRDSLSTTEFFLDRSERRKALNGLFNIAWETGLRERGFHEYQLANERAMFLPSDNVLKQRYTDPLGRVTRPITLVGLSDRYSCYWHAAISARAALYPWPRYSIRLHVAFTSDGTELIAEGEKAFKLRRTFCKSFWNDRWRRILFALATRLADGDEEISISTAGEESIKVGFPFELELPYSIASDHAVKADETTDDNLSELDLSDFGNELFDEEDNVTIGE